MESGVPVVLLVLVEPEGEAKKLLRVTLPLGMSLQAGTRVIIDNGQPLTGPYVICLPNGCMAEYEASDELVTKMKSGQRLHVQAINGSHQPISIPIPLGDFAKAYEGPPIDPKELEQQEKK
jgi:invasion protein IalB